MAASSASDIPDSKSDYCPCNRCTVARKQGRQEIIIKIKELAKGYDTSGDQILWRVGQDIYNMIGISNES
jgi:hypothetical protein